MKRLIASFTVIAAAAAIVVGGTTAFFSDTETSSGNTFTAGAIDLKIDSVAHYNGMICAQVDDDTYEWTPEEFVTLDENNHPTNVQDYDKDGWNESNPTAYPKAGDPCTGSWELRDLGSDDQQSSVVGYAFFTYNDLKPGDNGENTISLHVENNEAWACVEFQQVQDADNTQTEPEAAVDPDGLDSGELTENLDFFVWEDDGDNIFEPQGDDEGNWFAQVSGDEVQDGVLPIADSQNGNDPLDPDTVGYIGVAWCLGDISVAGDGTISCDGDDVGNEVQTDSLTFDVLFSVIQSRNNEDFVCSEGDDVREPIVSEGSVDFEDYAGARYRSFGNTGGEELYAGEGDLGVGANRSAAEFSWTSPGTHAIAVSYDASENEVTASIDGDPSVTHTAGLTCTPDKLQFSVVARDGGATVELNNVDLGGFDLGDGYLAEGDSSDWLTWNVMGFDFSSDFTFSADLDLTGSFGSSQELSKVQIDFGCETL